MEPIYTADNTTTAFQLNWSLALFCRCELPDPSAWLEELRETKEADGMRILSSHVRSQNTLQFSVSTRPASAPSEIVRSIKGRLQYLIRDRGADLSAMSRWLLPDQAQRKWDEQE